MHEVSPLTGLPVQGVVSEDRSFRFAALAEGLYTLTATRSGYTRARVFNVLVLPLKESTLGALLLTDAPESDAGQFPLPVPGADGGPCVGSNAAGSSSSSISNPIGS